MFIFDHIETKSLNGVGMNGPDFLTLCEEYIKAINEGTIPDIPDAWTSVVEVQCKQAVEKSLELYIRKMEELEH